MQKYFILTKCTSMKGLLLENFALQEIFNQTFRRGLRFITSTTTNFARNSSLIMEQIAISAAALGITTLLGAILGLFIKNLSHRWNDTILGYSAGIMLAAATIGLIVPAFETSGHGEWWIIVAGVMCGAMLINLIDFILPHLHTITGLDPEKHMTNGSINRILLFVMAIAIHKFPEGMAAGVSMNEVTPDGGASWTVSMGIALQNIPESMVIIAPLLLAGVSRTRTALIALAIGTLEVAGVYIGYTLGNISPILLPAMLGFAGGAMLYVTSDEMIPETHTHGYQKQATYALLLGFMTLIIVEKMMG